MLTVRGERFPAAPRCTPAPIAIVPINYIVYAVCAIVIIVALLETTGLMDGGHGGVLNHRI